MEDEPEEEEEDAQADCDLLAGRESFSLSCEHGGSDEAVGEGLLGDIVQLLLAMQRQHLGASARLAGAQQAHLVLALAVQKDGRRSCLPVRKVEIAPRIVMEFAALTSFGFVTNL